MRLKGKLTSWNHEKGFGFIMPNDGGKRVFVHITALRNRQNKPNINQPVSYSLSQDKQGRPCAVNVSRVDDHPAQSKKVKKGSNANITAAVFLIIVCISTLLANTPYLILPLYLLLSVLTYAVYAKDKSAAKRGQWRTPESTLHFLALACGWPGALIAQEQLRHKSKKQEFRLVFWLTVLVNISLFIWLHTPAGMATLGKWLNNL